MLTRLSLCPVWLPCCQDEELQLGFEGQEEDDHVSCLTSRYRTPLTTFLPSVISPIMPLVCFFLALLPTYSGTGRMSHLKDVNRRFKNGFREGGHATKKTKTESS